MTFRLKFIIRGRESHPTRIRRCDEQWDRRRLGPLAGGPAKLWTILSNRERERPLHEPTGCDRRPKWPPVGQWLGRPASGPAATRFPSEPDRWHRPADRCFYQFPSAGG